MWIYAGEEQEKRETFDLVARPRKCLGCEAVSHAQHGYQSGAHDPHGIHFPLEPRQPS